MMESVVNEAFESDSKLRKRIFDAINETPQHAPLFNDIARHCLAVRQSLVATTNAAQVEEHRSKKRRLEEPTPNRTSITDQPRQVILEARDLSFSLPQRKKFHLNIVQYGAKFHDPKTVFALAIINPASDQVESEVPLESFGYALRLPVPEKAQKQYNFCLLLATSGTSADPLPSGDGFVWSVNHGPLKTCRVTSSELQQIVGSDDVLEKALNAVLQKTATKLVLPSDAEFASAVPEAHRKNETAYHVKAHRGSKDGFLYFLENGIFFGFKKPLALFPFQEIESVSYTAILQRTFNLVITTQAASDEDSQEIEFSMLDQVDFGGIDSYIKQHQLQDASLAEARKAKHSKVNGKAVDQSDGISGQTELEKAEAELVDEEDELEEDYDPGSEGESEGSGSSDEDDGYENQPGNLVEDELGSEAEEVEIDDDEEEEEEDDHDDEEQHQDKNQSRRTNDIKLEVRQDMKMRPGVPEALATNSTADVPAYDDDDQL